MTAPATRTRFVILSAGAVTLMCLAIAAPVFAFTSRSTHGFVIPKDSKGFATTTCPRGEHVAFGGLVAQFARPIGAGPVVFPEGMRRTADNAWTVYGVSRSQVTGSRLTAVAYCDRGKVPSIASQTVPVPGQRSASATATCPAGTVVVGGGYNTGASPQHQESVVRLERSSSMQWRVSVANLATRSTSLTAIAYCGSGPAPKVYSTTVPLVANHGATARVHCPSGTSIVFGGLQAKSPTAHGTVSLVVPFSWTAASKSEWDVSGTNLGGAPGTLVALAYCR